MSQRGLIFRLMVVGVVFLIDYKGGGGLAGFALALLYLLGALVSLVRRDTALFKARFVMAVLFAVEVVAALSVIESPPDTGFFDTWIEKMSKDPSER